MASVLAGVRPNNQPVDLAGSLLGGQQARQSVLAGQQSLQQGQMALDRAPQIAAQQDAAAAQQKQLGQQQISENEYSMAVQRARVINRLATQVRQMPMGQRGQFVQALDPELLQSLNIDPEQIKGVQLDDQSLDAIIAQTDAALSSIDGQGPTADQRNRQELLNDLEGGIDPATGQLKPEDQLTARQRNAAVELNLLERPGTRTGRERVATDRELTTQVAESEALIKDRVTRAENQAKNAEGQIKEYFNQLQSINSNIANYNEAIAAIDEGAGVGAIQSKLPSIRAASVKLDNVQSRLGLDVIGNTTFGALSESELAFALSSALPQNLEGPELRQWIERKRDSQLKLADYIDNAIQFLSIPGNTLADLRAEGPSRGAPGGGQAEPSIDDLLRQYGQ